LALLVAGTASCKGQSSVTENTDGQGNGAARRGISQMEAGAYQQAIESLTEALSLGVTAYNEDTIWAALGRSHNLLDQYEESIAAYEEALELNPQNNNAWVGLGATHRLSGDYSAAEQAYTRALAIDPNYAELHASLGALYIHTDRAEEAVQTLHRALDLDPSLAIAHSNLAYALAKTGQFDAADIRLIAAIDLGYENGATLSALIDELRAEANQPAVPTP